MADQSEKISSRGFMTLKDLVTFVKNVLTQLPFEKKAENQSNICKVNQDTGLP